MRRIIQLLIINFTLFIVNCFATIHYVSHSGSNTPPYLTWETAADSIQSAINVCSPGDTVLVANGIYPENLVINNIPINLLGSSMDSTIIDGTALGNYTILISSNGNIENFNIYGKGDTSLVSRAIRSTKFYTTVEVKNCRISKAGVGIGMVGGDLIANNLYMNKLTRGFNLFGESQNYVDNSVLVLDKENSIGIDIGYAPNVDNFITNNIIIMTDTNGTGNGRGIITGTSKRVYIYNNLISGRFPVNIDLGNDIQDTAFVINNTILYQATNGPGSIETGVSKTIVNNVIMGKNHRGIYSNGSTKSNYNIFWKNGQDLNGLSYGDSDMVRDPMFVKDTLPNPNLDFDYHLQAFSPGIDKGDSAIKDVDGTRSDIGMFGGPYGQSYTSQDLAPRPPVNLSAIVDTNGILLKWNKNTEADTAYYKVYRDTVNNFIIDSAKIIGTPADTFFTDIPLKGMNHLVYKITAVDKQGNQSGPSTEVAVTITAVKNYPTVINDYELYQNYPNPFNPATKIGYRLKENGYVKLMVYDILGRLVKVLVNKYQAAGYYEVEFRGQKSEAGSQLASGIYIYRIEVIGKGNIPKFTDMKKMVLIK